MFLSAQLCMWKAGGKLNAGYKRLLNVRPKNELAVCASEAEQPHSVEYCYSLSVFYFAFCFLHVTAKERFILHHREAMLENTVDYETNMFFSEQGDQTELL